MDAGEYKEITSRIAFLTDKKSFWAEIDSIRSGIEIAECNAELAILYEREERSRIELAKKWRRGFITARDAIVFYFCMIPVFIWLLLEKIDNPFYDFLAEQGWSLVVSPLIIFGLMLFGAVYIFTGRINEKSKKLRVTVLILYPLWVFLAGAWLFKMDEYKDLPIGELVALPAAVFVVLPVFLLTFANLVDD